jgi:phthiocerol/phenolphthiocerol synthesis type-I polyketide synthase E
VVFLFPGQGAQRLGMGRGLYASEPEFRRQIDLCCDLLRPLLGLDLRAALWPDDDSAEARARLDQTALAQPALFVVEYALARLWMSWGIAPVAMLGHSLGEYVAACLAEVFTLEDALRLVAARGRLIQALEPGAMLAVPLSEREAREWLSDEIALAAVNRPTLCTLAGPTAAVDRLEAELSGRGVVCRRLHTSHAFHSVMMEPALEAFRAELRTIALRPPARPYISNRTGTWIRPEQATDPDFWVRHLRETVRFADGAATLLRETEALFLEVGPGTTLAGLVRQHPARPPGRLALSSLRPPREGDPEEAALLTALGRLWLAGVEPDWQGFSAHERRRRVALPTYPFERQRYWCETATGPAAGGSRAGVRRDDPADWFYTPSWRRSPLPLAAGSPAAPQRWLVFAADAPLAGALIERLAQLGHEVVRVAPGDGFADGGDGSFRIDPRRPEDAAALLTELARRGPLPARLLHLWTLSPAGADPDDPAEQRRQLDLGFHSLVALAQALGRLAPAALPPALQLDLVSSNLHEVVGDDLWWPEKAAALGPLRALPKELAGVHCRGLDVDTPRTPAAAGTLLERLLAELLAPAGPDQPVVAYRGPHRWVPEFASLPLPASASPLSRLRPGGSYLITGGLGGVGLTFAEELARSAGARLTLLGRSGLPPREEWDGWLAHHGEDDATSRRLLRLRQIEELGGEVLVVAADVADEAQVRAAVAAARERFGAVHGVVHAAGVSTGGLLQLRTARQIDEVLAPKIQGTRALAAALAPDPLDFFLLCSSRSAFLARAGGADYAGANAFLDAFAHQGRAAWGDGLVAVDWCAWRDVGMLADAARQARITRADAGAGAETGERDLPAGEPTPHPLLERRQAASDGGGDSFFVRFSARRQWVANEHRIAGHPVIPGTTYLEMARAAFEQRTGQTAVELYDIFFLAPVRLRDDEERLLRLTLEPDGGAGGDSGDGFAFRISNRAAGRPWEETMLGRLRPLASNFEPRRHDLAELRRRCSRPVPDDYERLEDFGPRWQNVRQLHVAPGEVLGLLELAEDFAGDLTQFRLHPSLLDRAAGLAAQCRAYLLDDRHAELIHSFYLPLSYASLKVRAPLPRRFYSHVRLQDLDYARNETVTFDALLLDEEGRELVEITSYSTKRVNNAQEQMRALTTLAAAEPAGGGLEGGERAEGAVVGAGADTDGGGPTMFDQALELGITPAEGQEVLRRVLAAHPLPPQIVVSPGDLASAIAEAAAADPSRLLEAAGDLAAGSRELHDRPDLGTPYAAPRNGVEEQLAALWQEALGVARVGIDDNFFELGGDSVLGIQVVARAHRLGLQISPAQLFEYQTIAQLAGVLQAGASPAGPAAAPEAVPSEGGEGGEVPLTPNQVRLFERGYPNPHRLNIAQLFEAHIPLDWRRLDAILAGLGRDHDALRLRFSPTSNSWRQELTPATPDTGPAFSLLDLAALPADRQSGAIEQAAADLHDSLHLTRGPLVRLAAFELGGDALGRRPSRLLFLGHHLVLDHISVYILADDIGRLYEAAAAGRGASRALTSAPYRAWAQRLHRFAGSAAIAEEAAYWLNLPWERTVRLPLDVPTGSNTGRSARTVTAALTAEETRALLDELPHALDATVEEVLLAAVAWGLSSWTGAPVQLLQRVGHGRISPFADLEISRTVGWFALDYPVVLDLAAAADPRAAVQAVVDQMRRVPREGVGYGLLRYLARQPDLAARFRALPAAEVSFNYIGREGLRRARRETAFREAAESSGDGFGRDVRRPSLLNVRTFLTGDCLQLSFTYSEAIHRAATVERLAAGCSAALAELLDALTARELT